MRVALGADEDLHLVSELSRALEDRGHVVARYGAAAGKKEPWADTAVAVAESVARGEHDTGVVCCWTGTGVSIAANKVPGVRAALCADAPTAAGARRWNDANVLALSLRATSAAELEEILDAWFEAAPSSDDDDAANIAHLAEIESRSPAS